MKRARIPWFTMAVAFGLLTSGAGACAHHYLADQAMAATDAGDYTALVEGCGNQLVAGYTYCRKQDGADASEQIFFVGPPNIDCNEDACVTFKVFFPNGQPSYGASIPKGQTKVGVPWKTLLGHDKFQVPDRGFWPFTYEIRWIDTSGHEQVTLSEGEIRLRVLAANYVSLSDVQADVNFAWVWQQDGAPVKMTTGARTFVGKVGP